MSENHPITHKYPMPNNMGIMVVCNPTVRSPRNNRIPAGIPRIAIALLKWLRLKKVNEKIKTTSMKVLLPVIRVAVKRTIAANESTDAIRAHTFLAFVNIVLRLNERMHRRINTDKSSRFRPNNLA
jgi:hypothetical protein